MKSGQLQKMAGHSNFVGVEPSERKELVTILSRGGFDVTCAPNGASALALAQNPPVELIRLGNHSSNLDGLEECRCLKQDSRPHRHGGRASGACQPAGRGDPEYASTVVPIIFQPPASCPHRSALTASDSPERAEH